MAERIRLDTGVKTYEIENERGEVIGEFSFFPSDIGILDRIEKSLGFFNELSFPEDITDAAARGEFCKRVCNQIDELFASKVSETLFERMHPLSIMKNGDFFFESAIEAICSVVQAETGGRIGVKLNKVRNATAKYSK